MLTDEEKQAIIDKYHTDKNYDLWDAFDAIERAVLAKAGEREHDIEKLGDQLANAEIAIQSLLEQKPAYRMGYQYDEGNEDPDLGGDLVLHQLDGKDYPVGTLFYAHPLPAQAIPEGWQLVPVEPAASMIDAGVAMALQVSVHGEGGWSKYLRGLYKQMLSASPKP